MSQRPSGNTNRGVTREKSVSDVPCVSVRRCHGTRESGVGQVTPIHLPSTRPRRDSLGLGDPGRTHTSSPDRGIHEDPVGSRPVRLRSLRRRGIRSGVRFRRQGKSLFISEDVSRIYDGTNGRCSQVPYLSSLCLQGLIFSGRSW